MGESERQLVSFTMLKDVLEAADELAERLRLTRTAIVELCFSLGYSWMKDLLPVIEEMEKKQLTYVR
jgi:hypothetical protein